MKTLLFVDDDKNIRAALGRVVRGTPYHCHIVSSAAEAISLLESKPFDLVVTDYQMPEIDGVTLCRTIQHRFPTIPRIMMSGQLSLSVATVALNEGGISLLLHKPVPGQKLLDAIADLLITKHQTGSGADAKEGVLKQLESEFPGISAVHRDGDGNIIL